MLGQLLLFGCSRIGLYWLVWDGGLPLLLLEYVLLGYWRGFLRRRR
jgi:hypothetical protein